MLKKISFFGLAAALACGLVPAQTFGGPITPASIADGTNVCVPGAITTVPVNVTAGTAVPGVITVAVGLTHTWYTDLKVTLTSPTGVTVTLLAPSCEDGFDAGGTDLNGTYTFSESATNTIDGVVGSAVTPPATAPVGTYLSDFSLAPLVLCGSSPVGTWTFRFQDFINFDTGTVTSASITLSAGSLPAQTTFALCQTGPGAPVVIRHAGGQPNAIFTNAVVIGNPASVPNGWWFGLDIPYLSLIQELTFTPGFFWGNLDGAGNFASVPLPLPPTVVLSVVAVHFNAAGLPYFVSEAFNYTIL